jgi:hypothetical protein
MLAWLIIWLTLIPLTQAAVAAPPAAALSNSEIRARVYLPDAESGYYRGTRFDWSGAIASLEWHGHSYFGKWFDRYDPMIHDAITGPVEEFLTNGAGLGYDEAKPGESFVRIGVGAVRKPDEAKYRQFSTYDIVDPGKWTVTKGSDWIQFVHELRDTNGYAYVYRKKLRLVKNTLVLEHELENTGHKTIATTVYEHDFFMLDGKPTGPDSVVRFAFEPRATSALDNLAAVRDKTLVYMQELQPRETVATDLEGFGAGARDYDIRVENRLTGAGVRQTGDRPMSKLHLWSIRTTICPEAFIDLRIEPGKASMWRITYEFYAVPRVAQRAPVTIELLQDVEVTQESQIHVSRGKLYLDDRNAKPFRLRKAQRFVMIKTGPEGSCRIRFEDTEYAVSSCPWMEGFTDHQTDIFRVVAAN